MFAQPEHFFQGIGQHIPYLDIDIRVKSHVLSQNICLQRPHFLFFQAGIGGVNFRRDFILGSTGQFPNLGDTRDTRDLSQRDESLGFGSLMVVVAIHGAIVIAVIIIPPEGMTILIIDVINSTPSTPITITFVFPPIGVIGGLSIPIPPGFGWIRPDARQGFPVQGQHLGSECLEIGIIQGFVRRMVGIITDGNIDDFLDLAFELAGIRIGANGPLVAHV